MGSDAEDLALTVHPHPTLSETLGFPNNATAEEITETRALASKAPRGLGTAHRWACAWTRRCSR